MFGINSINGSVQWLGVPAPLRTDGLPWTDNIFAPSPAWRTGGTATNPNLGSQPGGPYGSVVVPWSGTVRAMLTYVRRSPENTGRDMRRVRDDLLEILYGTHVKYLHFSQHPPQLSSQSAGL